MFNAVSTLLNANKRNGDHFATIESFLHEHDMQLQVQFKAVKNVNFRVKPHLLYVSAPKYISTFELANILTKRLDWAVATHSKLLQRKTHPTHIKDKTFHDGDVFQLWGKDIILSVDFLNQSNASKNCDYHLDYDKQILTVIFPKTKEDYNNETLQKTLQNVFIQIFKQQISTRLPALLSKWQAQVGKEASEVRLKKMHTRWGSCNVRAKRVWLSAYLAQYPLSCIEYVIVHELCHLHEANHSKRFWYQVEKAMPDYKVWHDYLRGSGQEID